MLYFNYKEEEYTLEAGKYESGAKGFLMRDKTFGEPISFIGIDYIEEKVVVGPLHLVVKEFPHVVGVLDSLEDAKLVRLIADTEAPDTRVCLMSQKLLDELNTKDLLDLTQIQEEYY